MSILPAVRLRRFVSMRPGPDKPTDYRAPSSLIFQIRNPPSVPGLALLQNFGAAHPTQGVFT